MNSVRSVMDLATETKEFIFTNFLIVGCNHYYLSARKQRRVAYLSNNSSETLHENKSVGEMNISVYINSLSFLLHSGETRRRHIHCMV